MPRTKTVTGQKARAHMARIIVDPRDASRDYFIPRDEAHRYYLAGALSLDLTNTTPREPVYRVN